MPQFTFLFSSRTTIECYWKLYLHHHWTSLVIIIKIPQRHFSMNLYCNSVTSSLKNIRKDSFQTPYIYYSWMTQSDSSLIKLLFVLDVFPISQPNVLTEIPKCPSPFLFYVSFCPSLLTKAEFLAYNQKYLPAWLVRIKAHSPRTTVSRRTETAIPVVLGIGADKLLRCTWSLAPFIGQLWWHHLLWKLGCCTRRLHSLLWDLHQWALPCFSKSEQFLSFFLFNSFH